MSDYDWDRYEDAKTLRATMNRRRRSNGGILVISHNPHQTGKGRAAEALDPDAVLAWIAAGPHPTGDPVVITPAAPVAPAAPAQPIGRRGPRPGESADRWQQRLRDAAAAAI